MPGNSERTESRQLWLIECNPRYARLSRRSCGDSGRMTSGVAHIPELDRLVAENLLVVCQMGPNRAALLTAHRPSFGVNFLEHRIAVPTEGARTHLDIAHARESRQRRRSASQGFRLATAALAVITSKGMPHRCMSALKGRDGADCTKIVVCHGGPTTPIS